MTDWKWINIFARDILLACLMMWVNFEVEYKSWWAAFIMGALVVLVSWHFIEYKNIRRRL